MSFAICNEPDVPAAWCLALTLRERAALAPAADPAPLDGGRGARRVQRWRSQAPFDRDDGFARRLAADGLTEARLQALLGESAEDVRSRLAAPPAWLEGLTAPYAGARPGAPREPEGEAGAPTAADWLGLVEPLARPARERVREGARALARSCPAAPFDPETIEPMLFARLAEALGQMTSRTLVLELNAARLGGQLEGETPRQRCRYFLARLRDPAAARALLQEYPVLGRSALAAAERWAEASLEFLRHLVDDRDAIAEAFVAGAGGGAGGGAPGPGVVAALQAAGDPHRGGRQVLIVDFGSGLRLVYKPRSLAVDAHFGELVAWLNAQAPVPLTGAGPGEPLFRAPRLVDRGDRGWVEFIEARPCSSPDEVRRFYERQGAYLALLYALCATDFHLENLIAEGEHPVLIDLESFFHPPWGDGEAGTSSGLAGESLGRSVLRVGLLPQRIWDGVSSEGVEMSGLGGRPGQLSPGPVPAWADAGTDEQRLVLRRVPMPGARNRPALRGEPVDVLEHADAIVASFTAMYRHLEARRDELLAADGPLARFANDRVRVILRPTYLYGLLLRDGSHPDLLHDALDRDRFFDRLWLGVRQLPQLARVLRSERASLWADDVPYFTTRPGSRDLLTDAGEVVADFFDQAGMELVGRQLRRLGDEDWQRQVWYIRASFTALEGEGGRVQWAGYRPRPPAGPAGAERLLDAARAVGDRLDRLALRGADDATWIGLTLVGPHRWKLAAAGTELYSGLPGIALFLAQLGAATGEARYTDLARRARATLLRQVDRSAGASASLGAFSGLGGVIYALAHLGALWGEPEAFARAEGVAALVPSCLPNDANFDVIGGAAGCLAGLASLYRCRPSAGTLETAVRCGDALLGRAERLPAGIGWTPAHSQRPLAGFSHGAAGIAAMLFELSDLSGGARFHDAARAALAYERSLFSPEGRNWPDVSDLGPGEPLPSECKTLWCHGAPGVALGRLRSLPQFDDAEVRREIDDAVAATLARGLGSNHSLCHGDLGNIETLLQAGRLLGDGALVARAYEGAATVLDGIDEHGPLCGVPLAVEVPGLMTGIAGIGYELLRLADPDRVPSVLALEPPRPASPVTGAAGGRAAAGPRGAG
ncbi:MAG TPA: type 2 lanthipeptide synthetase LanM family protein [Polyangiaceae bacterium]|nr:type 2 lanthipeptide synthetase LanM family protein [Polyangiaceae bacterium]